MINYHYFTFTHYTHTTHIVFTQNIHFWDTSIVMVIVIVIVIVIAMYTLLKFLYRPKPLFILEVSRIQRVVESGRVPVRCSDHFIANF